ncbi:MAG: phenylalanine--tRNA ligase beta subunit-related protein [Oscillospiraceae bacterium]
MRFEISQEVFAALPDACFGAVAVRGVNNSLPRPEIEAMLAESIALCETALRDVRVKLSPEIIPYRNAFIALGINPNKYMCSIEALLTRISKGKGFPHISPIVDLGNAVSLKYRLPIGAHDLGTIPNALEVRPAREGDSFIPFGGTEAELPELGEVIYVSDAQVRTRRWTWRQSELGKIDADTHDLLFPIDGFTTLNLDRVLAARTELAESIERLFGASTETALLDAAHPVFEL